MFLSDVSVKRPVFAAVIAILLVLAGAVAFFSLSVREVPDIDPPIVSIETNYRGAAANVVESRITQVIEDRISGIEGVESITSNSENGRSSISIEFSSNRDIDAAANDVRDRVSGVLDNIPEEADPPEIRKVDADEQPIMWIALSGKGWTSMQLTDYADRFLVDRFGSIDGVARVQIGGEARPSMRIWIDRERLAALGLTVGDVEAALRRQNVELPAGRVETQGQNLTVRLNRAYANANDFRQLIVSRGETGYLVRLGDVARVEVGPENPYSLFRGNGVSAVGLGIVRQSGANTLEVADAARAVMESAQKNLPEGVNLDVNSDSSQFISAAIDNVYQTLIEAAVLVVLVIYVFLGSARATLIPAITVPICLLATFIVLWALGFSINLLTLLALVLAIGIVVDDAIVVLENIYHRIEQGESPLVASYKGASQVAFAVVATTLVVCAVFVPVMFISGNTGMLFRELAAAMIGAIAFSGFIALSLTPMLCSKMLKPAGSSNRFTRFVDARFERLNARYEGVLRRIINKPLLAGGAALMFVIACLGLGTTLQSELAPEEDQGNFQISVTAAEGTGWDTIVRYMGELERELLPMIEDGPIRRLMVRAPNSFGASEDFAGGRIMVFLHSWADRDVTTREVVQQVEDKLRDNPAVRVSAAVPSALSRGRGRPLMFVIAGDTFEELASARDKLLAAAESNPNIRDLDSDYKETRPQVLIDIDTARAGDLGVSVTEIGSTLETMMGSRRATTFVDRGEEYYVVLQAEAEDRISPQDLTNVYVRSSTTGQLVALSNLVTLRNFADAGSLGRYNKLRAVTLSGSLAPGYSLGEALTWLENEAAQIPEITQVGYKGESLSYKQTGSSIVIVFLLTIIIVYLVLAAQFESFIHPAVIILTVPLAVGGGVLGLVVMGGTLNIYSQIGIVMLVGLAAKNGILIVEFANQLRDSGRSIEQAVIEASTRRLRPILMTSIAIVAGAIPLMIASGAGAAARQAIGVVIVWGVSIATLLTLFLIPVFYNRLARRTGSPEAVARKLKDELGGGAAQPAE
ncbi:efflux RND transporter permease subunit [Sphingoaurantiacus capsulatus]|uniref:Efflux RND transporter permease subunit n=1 Tax=Sphingoaurantiacus capsulatus TaxID=1771310 RepID=A0ABV7XBG2_9SPHN